MSREEELTKEVNTLWQKLNDQRLANEERERLLRKRCHNQRNELRRLNAKIRDFSHFLRDPGERETVAELKHSLNTRGRLIELLRRELDAAHDELDALEEALDVEAEAEAEEVAQTDTPALFAGCG